MTNSNKNRLPKTIQAARLSAQRHVGTARLRDETDSDIVRLPQAIIIRDRPLFPRNVGLDKNIKVLGVLNLR